MNKKDIQPYWRPDYRNPATLPDIKVVRTDFIVNFVAILVALAVIGFILQREYRAWSVGSTVGDMKDQIRLAEPDDKIALKQSEAFRQSGRYVQDLESFYKVPFFAHDLILELSELKNDDLILSNVNFSETVVKAGKKSAVQYRVSLNGDVRDLTALDDYVVSLRSLEIFEVAGYELKVAEDPRPQDDSTGLYPYAIEISLRPVVQSSKKKGAKK